jgi:hypothetical protein
MTEKSKTTKKDSLVLTLLTVAFAIPGLTILIIRFLFDSLGDTGWARFAALLLSEIGGDLIIAISVMSFFYLVKFTSQNPSYKKFSTKSNLKFAVFMISCAAVCYIVKLVFYIQMVGEINFSTFFSLMTLGFGFPMLLFPIVISDDNLYIGAGWKTYSVDKIKLDNFDEIEKANIRHEDYLDLKFLYDDKEVKARISRKEMAELRELLRV